jgi:DnaJ-class molecular chaperone
MPYTSGAYPVKDHYATLGIRRDASRKEIGSAFRKLAKKYHPDVCKETWAEERFKEINETYRTVHPGDHCGYHRTERFKEINETYRTLSDSGMRADYDRILQQNNSLKADCSPGLQREHRCPGELHQILPGAG